jgi:hypothetical protein
MTFSGATSIGANQPTVTSKTGAAVAFGTGEAICYQRCATVSGSSSGVMTLYKAEAAA